jgi:integrase
MLGGIRTEEARALRWPEVDLDAGTASRILIDRRDRLMNSGNGGD